MKKLLCLLLALLMLAGLCACDGNSNGLPQANPDDFTYTVLNDGTIEITGYSGSDKSLSIPSKIDGRRVTIIGGGAFDDCKSLTSVTIPNGVTSIGRETFSGCKSLTSVTIPNSVRSIGGGAFEDCESLTSITLPKSVTNIGSNSFSDCSSLTEIIVDSDNLAYSSLNGVLFNKNQTTIVQYPAGKTAVSYTIPNSVKSIGEKAFVCCFSLTSVTIPNSVTSIGEQAFEGCTSLSSVTIPNSVTSIGDFSFFCTSLKTVYFNSAAQRDKFKSRFPSDATLIVQ